MLDPQPALAMPSALEEHGRQRQAESEQPQQAPDPLAPRPSSLTPSSLRALVVHLPSPMAGAVACVRPSSLPVFHQQVHALDDSAQDDDGMVEIVLDGAAEGAAGDVEQKATCMICYTEDLSPEETLAGLLEEVLTGEEGRDDGVRADGRKGDLAFACPHSFCRACIAAYMRTRVGDGRATFPCPLFGEDRCEVVYGEAELQKLLDPETHRKHRRLQSLKADPSLRECPSCHRLVAGGSKRQRALECPGCKTRFCWLHHLACAEDGCAGFERAARRRERASVSTVRRISKPCPSCKSPIEKDGGCNHITCVHCRHEWCWLCLATYTPMHYSPTNLFFGCPGFQFLDMGAAGRGGAATCCVLRIVMALFLLPTPLLLGAAFAVAVSLVWLPIGLAWALGAACRRALANRGDRSRHHRRQRHEEDDEEAQQSLRRRPLVRCMGGGWEAIDLAFPLFACTRTFRQGNGWWGAVYVLVFLGAAPLVIALAFLMQLLWLPLAGIVLLVRLSRHRRCRPGVLVYPLTAAALILDLDGE